MFFGSGGCDATSPPFVEVGPTHVFVAASDAEQSVGERRSQVFGSRSGTSPCGTVQAATATLGKPKSDTAPKRKTDFTKKVGRTLRARYPSGGAGGMNSFFRVSDPTAAGGRRGRPTYCGTVHAKARIERGFARMQESEMPKKCRKFAAILFLRPLPV